MCDVWSEWSAQRSHMTQNIGGACVMCGQNGVHRDRIYFPFLFPFSGKLKTLKQRLKTAVNLDLRTPMESLEMKATPTFSRSKDPCPGTHMKPTPTFPRSKDPCPGTHMKPTPTFPTSNSGF